MKTENVYESANWMWLPIVAGICLVHITNGQAQAQAILLDKSDKRQELLIAGAKKEGQVTIYSAMIVNQALRPLVTGFMKKYPFIKARYWRGNSEKIIAKVSAEVRAKNLVVDVVEGTGIGELAGSGGITTPFYTPLLKNYPEKLRDKDGIWVPTRLSYFAVAYNTKQVTASEVPKSYDDLLNPKWKGKMAWRIGTSSGTPLFLSNLRIAWGEEKAMAYFKKLQQQKIVNFGAGSARTLVDRVIAGEFTFALNIFAHHPIISKAKGAPVNTALLDPVPATSATMVLPKGVRHPHAALLLIDFVLSREGQEILSKANYFPARPDVEPQKKLWPVVPSKAGVTETFVNPEQMLKYTDSSTEIYNKMFRE
jgi:iron(III) transport system substrate-binding protein